VKEGNYIYLRAFCVHVSKSILIIILNWNCAHDTMEAIRSVYASKVEPYTYDIFLVDNGSKDDSVQKLRAFFASEGLRVEEIHDEQTTIAEKGTKKIFFYISPVNTGFAGGNNIGMRFALKNGYDFVFLLNADAVVSQDCIKVLVETMKKDASIGIAGPKVYYYDFHGKKNIISFAGGRINLWKGLGNPLGGFPDEKCENKIKEVDYIEGSAMMIRDAVLNKVGLFDERFFAYWEDSDLCLRARKNGFKVMFIPDSFVYHRVSMGGYDFLHYSYNKIKLLTQNRMLFMRKHASTAQKFFFVWYFPYSILAALFLRTIRRRDFTYSIETIKATFDGIREFIRIG